MLTADMRDTGLKQVIQVCKDYVESMEKKVLEILCGCKILCKVTKALQNV